MKTLVSAILAILISTPVFANERGEITKVTPIYRDNYVTKIVDRCYDVEVPNYVERRGANGGEVLGGMIIGGLLGKGITGNDDGAAIGAIIGGVAAGEKNRQVQDGYRVERQCTSEERVVNEPELIHYVVEFKWRYKIYSQRTQVRYNVGDSVRIEPKIQ